MWDNGPGRKSPAAFVSRTAAKIVRTEAEFEPADGAPGRLPVQNVPLRPFSRFCAQRIGAPNAEAAGRPSSDSMPAPLFIDWTGSGGA